MVRQEIIKLIKKATGKSQKAIQVEHPEEKSHGDYSTNIALQLKKNPSEIAKKLKSDLFEKVEVAGPGFINFFISKEYLQKQIREILKEKDKFGQLKIGKNQKVNIEFISANPTGPLHLGHGRGAFYGDTLANVFQKAGYKIIREYYINDAKNSVQIRELGKTALGKGKTYLNNYLREKIKKLKPKIQKCKNEGETGYLLAQEIQKDVKSFIEKKLKIKFDKWISEEKDLYQKNKIKEIRSWFKKKNLIYKKDKAIWLKTSKYGDIKDWVVIRKTGEPTYLLSDAAYHKNKFDRKFDKIIDIWGADHQGHVGKIKAIAKILNYKGDLDILISQVVRFKTGKISKRKGNVVTLEWLIDEVGLDTVRFFYLMKSLQTQMEFNVELAKKRSEKSPVYYVQYAHARIASILRKLKAQNSKFKTTTQSLKLLEHPSELNLIKELIRLPEIVEDTAKDCQMQRFPQYAIDLATVFHQFYRDCRVISKDKELTKARLSLVLASKAVLKNTLELMGISAPEKM